MAIPIHKSPILSVDTATSEELLRSSDSSDKVRAFGTGTLSQVSPLSSGGSLSPTYRVSENNSHPRLNIVSLLTNSASVSVNRSIPFPQITHDASDHPISFPPTTPTDQESTIHNDPIDEIPFPTSPNPLDISISDSNHMSGANSTPYVPLSTETGGKSPFPSDVTQSPMTLSPVSSTTSRSPGPISPSSMQFSSSSVSSTPEISSSALEPASASSSSNPLSSITMAPAPSPVAISMLSTPSSTSDFLSSTSFTSTSSTTPPRQAIIDVVTMIYSGESEGVQLYLNLLKGFPNRVIFNYHRDVIQHIPKSIQSNMNIHIRYASLEHYFYDYFFQAEKILFFRRSIDSASSWKDKLTCAITLIFIGSEMGPIEFFKLLEGSPDDLQMAYYEQIIYKTPEVIKNLPYHSKK